MITAGREAGTELGLQATFGKGPFISYTAGMTGRHAVWGVLVSVLSGVPLGCACRAEPGKPGPGDGAAGWVVAYHEDFESGAALPLDPGWQPDEHPDDDPFSDAGAYFRAQGIVPPPGYRLSTPLGTDGWLRAESYSRSSTTAFTDLVAIVADPSGTSGRVLRLRSPAHTDATVIRSSQPLPSRYRVSLRVGFAEFGDGLPGSNNGYDGGERAGPWLDADATEQNGFYWLAILDTVPLPHNNTWIHHHRKVVIDSDNHFPPWMEIFNGTEFIASGEHPVMIMGLDGEGATHLRRGKPFLSWSAGQLQPSGAIRAVDSYLPDTWYRASIERTEHAFVVEVSGVFRHGGARTYRAVFDIREHCIWHYNGPGENARPECIDDTPLEGSHSAAPQWPAGVGWPDYFMFGDPHINFYEGQVYYDDIRLEVWQEE